MINRCIDIYKKNEEVVMYLIMGVLATIVNISVKYALLFTILNPKTSCCNNILDSCCLIRIHYK